jgi:chromosome partitioning protein
MNTRVIAVGNQKGGVGKTTTSVNLGHALAMLGFSVLLVDLDSQGHVSWSLGIQRQPGLYNLLNPAAQLPLDRVTVPSGRQRLDVVPGDKSTAGIKMALAGEDYREQYLKRALQPAIGRYHYVILDCGPTLDILNVNAFHAATHFLITVKVDALALVGVADYIESLSKHLGLTGRAAQTCVLAIVPTMFDQVTRESREVYANLLATFGHSDDTARRLMTLPVAAPVPVDTKLREASRFGRTIWEYAPKSSAAAAYVALMERVTHG